MKMGYAIQVLLTSAFSAVNNASRVLVVVFCASSTTQGDETQGTPAPANLVSNWPAGAPPSHVVQAAAVPRQEPVIEPPSSAPTNGPSLADFGVGASWPVRQEIRLLDDGAAGDYGLLKVSFPADITAAPVTIITPDGRTLACRPTFLALYDNASGQSVLLGEVKPSIGELVGDNTVIYPDAFDTISADIRYRYTKYWLEQDIILHEAIQLPEAFQSENALLEVWSEWIDSPPDAIEAQTIELRPPSEDGVVPAGVATDEHARFGAARIADGYAFGIQSEGEKIPVAKTFTRIEGRDWLIERVDYTALKPELDKLPKPQASLAPEKLKSDRAILVRSLHAQTDSRPSGKTMQLAKASSQKQSGLVLDFIIVSSVPAPADIISWWPGGNTTDVIGANHVSLANGATHSGGKVGQAFSLDGVNDRITAPDSATLDFGAGQDFSLEAWIKAQDSGNSYGVATILSKRYAPGAGTLGYELYLIHGVLGLRLDDPQNLYAFQSSSADLRDGNFHHVAATVDRDSTSGLKLYVDGVVVGTFNPTVVPGDLSNSEPWRIGNHPTPSLNCFFKGIIDEPAVYGRALGQSEIQAIYHAGVAGKIDPTCVAAPANIVAWWPGDGNGYDLARINFATPSGATYAPAVVSQGFSFDGVNDGVTAAHDNALNLVTAEDEVTVAAWIKPLANTTTYGVMSVIGKRYAPNAYTTTGYEMFLINGVPGFQIMNSSGVATFIATGDLRNGSYHHVAVTMDRNSTTGGKIYVDGTAILTFNPTVLAGSLANNDPVRIGVHPQPGFNGWYKGIIDEPTIYRRALSGTEITALYAAGSAGKCKTDTDSDGLTDLQENFLGTNPNDADTDNDGLTDGDEVFVHYTDPNNADTDGDGLSDGWEWNHFGSFAQDGNGDYDNDGVSNGLEYANGTDPNTIQFSTLFNNLRVDSSSANGTVTVIAGEPAKLAVLVDRTDFENASWVTYDSAFIANLGATEGTHQVWVGLKGRADTSVATWAGYVLTLDMTPPMIVITNPTAPTVFQSILQLQGYSPEPLASLRYDVVNDAGTAADLEGYVVKQFVDPDTLEITTNWFGCVDIALTNGLNTITLYATDEAGNMSTTVLNYEFALPTAPPAVEVYWPHDGARISGTSFTVRGRSSDATARVSAEVIGGGQTMLAEGIVERDGTFWIENLPLADGENSVNLTVTDVADNSTTESLVVVKSSLVLTIVALDPSYLNQPYVTVTGTINASDHKVWVNGVEATLNGDNTWTALDVPMTDGGTGIIQARAIPISDNGGNGTGGSGGGEATPEDPGNPSSNEGKDVEFNGEKPWEVIQISYFKVLIDTADRHLDPGEDEPYKEKQWETIRWKINQSGHWDSNDCWGKPSTTYYVWDDTNWEKTGKGFATGGLDPVCGIRGEPGEPYPFIAPTAWPNDYCSVAVSRERSDAFHVWTDTRARAAKTLYELRTGGKASAFSKRKSIFMLTANAVGIRNPWWPERETYANAVDIAPTSTVIGALGTLGNDGRLYKALEDNTTHDVTPKVMGNPYYIFYGPIATKHKVVHQTHCAALTDPDLERTQLGVGEYVNLYFDPPLYMSIPEEPWWLPFAGSVDPAFGSGTLFTAPKTPTTTTVRVFVRDAQLDTVFTVIAPTGAAVEVDSNPGPPGVFLGPPNNQIGAGTMYKVQFLPTTVSFANIVGRENIPESPERHWPNGQITQASEKTVPFSGLGCSSRIFDYISDGPVSIERLFNGTTYVDFSYGRSWQIEYQNDEEQWVPFASVATLTEFRGSDKKCRETYQGLSGTWQGPWQ